jgi:hypothetical protein
VRLSCCEIRRLFWQLVVAVERSAVLVLRWSWWRRWHQAWARFYHYRRQERSLAEGSRPQLCSQAAQAKQADMIDLVWERLEPLLPPQKRTGRPYEHPRRLVLEAIVYVMRTNCGWQHLANRLQPIHAVAQDGHLGRHLGGT